MKRILIIDDDICICENVTEILQLEGYDALNAVDGIMGVQMAHDAHPDLILCDIMMPGLDGFGVLQALQNNSQMAQIPVILLSARTDTKLPIGQGAMGYLAKPFSPYTLLKMIREALG